MRRAITYTSFAIAGVLVVVIFATSKSYTQLGIATLFYIPVAFFAYQIFLNTNTESRAKAKIKVNNLPVQEIKTENAKLTAEVVDIDKRAFLKLIGAAGLSFFLFSMLGRRVESLIFDKGSGPATAPGVGASSLSPSPTDGYRISEIDDSAISFYGFTNALGGWFIMKEDPGSGSFRYAKGELDFPRNWTDRESLKYDYFHDLF